MFAILSCIIAAALGSAVNLDAANFQHTLQSGPIFVKFYAPWCGHCKRLAPIWETLSEESQAGITIAKVDCTVATDVCSENSIRSYPTLKFFKDGNVETYSGARTIEALNAFLQTKMGEEAPKVVEEEPAAPVEPASAVAEKGLYVATDANFHKTIESGLAFVKFYAPWCGHCKTLAPNYDQVAEFYQNNKYLKIVKVDCTVEVVCSEFKINGYPTLILFKDGKEVERYNGGRSVVALTEYLQRQLSAVIESQAKSAPDQAVEVVGGLKVLTDDTFAAGVAHGYTLVKFHAPWCGHCKRLAPVWQELASAFQSGNAAVAKVDCTLYSKTCDKFGIAGYPSIKLFKDGSKVADYQGSRDLASLTAYLQEAASGKHDEL